MIAEWLYWLTCQISRNFNRAVGLEVSDQSNLLTGITFSWFMLLIVLLMLVCLLILYKMEMKERPADD